MHDDGYSRFLHEPDFDVDEPVVALTSTTTRSLQVGAAEGARASPVLLPEGDNAATVGSVINTYITRHTNEAVGLLMETEQSPVSVLARLRMSSPSRFSGVPPPLLMAIEGFIPKQGVGALSGPAAVGKSQLQQQMLMCIAAGLPFLGFETQPQVVLQVSLEDDDNELHRRFTAIIDHLRASHPCEWRDAEQRLLANYHVVAASDLDMRLTRLDHGNWTATAIYSAVTDRAVEIGAGFITLDPLSNLRAGSMNDDNEAAVIIRIAREIATNIDGFVLFGSHVTKAVHREGGDGLYSMAGSSNIENGVRWSAVLRPATKKEGHAYGWSEEQVEAGEFVTLVVPKASYLAKPPRLWLRRDGRILVPIVPEKAEAAQATSGSLSKHQGTLLQTLQRLERVHRENVVASGRDATAANVFVSVLRTDSGLNRQQWAGAFKALQNRRLIAVDGPFVRSLNSSADR